MCLKVFVAGDDKRYAQLKDEGCDWDQLPKVNFLRDLKMIGFERNYFPGVDLNSFDENAKKQLSMKLKKILE
jgi:hypothetical protein